MDLLLSIALIVAGSALVSPFPVGERVLEFHLPLAFVTTLGIATIVQRCGDACHPAAPR